MPERGNIILRYLFLIQSWLLFLRFSVIVRPQADSGPEHRHSSVTQCVQRMAVPTWSRQRVLIVSVWTSMHDSGKSAQTGYRHWLVYSLAAHRE